MCAGHNPHAPFSPPPARHLSPAVSTQTTPGAVWSIDFTHPPTPIDGLFPHILVVRDLASRSTLLSLPCAVESANIVIAALQTLFAEHGAPLVLKSGSGCPSG